MLRWLLPLVALFALLGQAVTAFAATGVFGDATCCCPIKAKCKCHDHDGDRAPAPTIKRCVGDAKLVAPAVPAALPAIDHELLDEPRVTIAPALAPLPLSEDVSRQPEKPPS